MDAPQKDPSTPAYIPLMTLTAFLGKLKATVVPPIVDTSLTKNMSGGTASALMSALRFLGLIEAGGKVREPLRKLVAAHETSEWAAQFATVVNAAYADLIGDLDLQTATTSMLEDRFRTNGKVSGQVLEKAVRFYLAALENSGQSISPLLKARKVRSSNGKKPASRARSRGAAVADNDETEELEDDGLGTPGTTQLKLPLPGKGFVVFTVPADLTTDDWKFIKPIFDMYLERMLADKGT